MRNYCICCWKLDLTGYRYDPVLGFYEHDSELFGYAKPGKILGSW
jgi:hypothetical protein